MAGGQSPAPDGATRPDGPPQTNGAPDAAAGQDGSAERPPDVQARDGGAPCPGACTPGATQPCEGCPNTWQVCTDLCTWEACTCPVVNKRVFVTRQWFTGNLGALQGAHANCQRAAQAAALPGAYKAWLSDAQQSPATTMTRHNGPYILVNGIRVANSWADLTGGLLLRPIDRDEYGQLVRQPFVCEGGEVWTNTTFDGRTKGLLDCLGWSAVTSTSTAGNVKYFDRKWSDSGCISITCASELPLYCVEQ
jgi:hypothetical protein